MDRITQINRQFKKKVPYYLWKYGNDLDNLNHVEVWRCFNRLKWGQIRSFMSTLLEREAFYFHGKKKADLIVELMNITGYCRIKDDVEQILFTYD